MMEEILQELERRINSWSMVVSHFDISRGEELSRELMSGAVAWLALYKNAKFAFYAAPNEKPFFIKPKRAFETDLEVMVIEGDGFRFEFLFVTDDSEREVVKEAKEEASISGCREELERLVG